MLDIPVYIGKTEYRIQSDSRNFILCTSVLDKDKNVQWSGIAFYSNLHACISGVLQYKIRASDASSILELQQCVRECTDQLKGLYETA